MLSAESETSDTDTNETEDYLEDIPTEIVDAFGEGRTDDEDVLIAIGSDLGPDGNYGAQYLLASNRRLSVISPNGTRPDTREWPIGDVSDIFVDLLVGQGSLIAVIDGRREELCRFSNSRQRDFHRAAKAVEKIAESGEMPQEYHDDEHRKARYCGSCGRLLPERGGVCPACLKKGQVMLRLVQYLKPHWKRALFLVGLMVLSASIQTAPPYLTKILVDDVLGAQEVVVDGVVTEPAAVSSIAWWDVSASGIGRVGWLAIIVSCFLLSRVMLLTVEILSGRQATWLGPRIIGDLRATLYHHMQKLSVSYYDHSRTGALLNRVMTDTSRVQSFLVGGVPHIGIDVFMVIMIGMILMSMNWQLTLYILIPLPIVIFTSKFFWRYIRSLFGRAYGRRSRLSAVLNDALSGIRVVKAFGQEEQEIERFDERNYDLLKAESNAEQTWATFFPMITFMSMIGSFVVWYIGGADVIGGRMSLGTLFAFFSYLSMFYRPIQMVSRLNAWVTRDLTAAERVFEVLDTEPEIEDESDAVVLENMEGRVEFEDAVFGYDPLRPVIKGITIDIQPGEMVGLVGRSGAGKSTIINLICRFYDPQEGRVLIDGVDLRKIKQREWHRRLGIVPQESFLFHGTIAENIAYARPEASRDDIIRAARAANAHHFIVRFPDGYDTQVGERGARLSGGERQRISIARAILNDPKILILDEATSAVDTETEQQIQEAISRLVHGRTVFAIAHRLSTLKNANRLLVIEDGQLVEFGTHDELVEAGGVYARLVEAQQELSALSAVGG